MLSKLHSFYWILFLHVFPCTLNSLWLSGDIVAIVYSIYGTFSNEKETRFLLWKTICCKLLSFSTSSARDLNIFLQGFRLFGTDCTRIFTFSCIWSLFSVHMIVFRAYEFSFRAVLIFRTNGEFQWTIFSSLIFLYQILRFKTQESQYAFCFWCFFLQWEKTAFFQVKIAFCPSENSGFFSSENIVF